MEGAAKIQDASPLIINSPGIFDLGGFSETVGSLAGTGIVTSSSTGTLILTAGGNNSITSFSGIIQNGSAISVSLSKAGTGTLTLSGVNTYTGATTITAGTLKLGASDLIANGSALSVTSPGVFDLAGYNETVASIAGSGLITSSAIGDLTLTTSGGTNTTFSGIIQNGSASSVSLTKLGAATLTLSGANTYTGVTTINAGTISVTTIGNGGVVSGNLGFCRQLPRLIWFWVVEYCCILEQQHQLTGISL